MGYRDLIKNAVNQAITSSIGDLKSTAIFRSISTSYDPDTGDTTETISTYTVTCALVGLEQQDQIGVLTQLQSDVASGNTIQTMRRVLVPALQLTGVSVDSLDDDVTIDGVSYVITSVKLDPSGALFSFVVRARSGTQLSAD